MKAFLNKNPKADMKTTDYAKAEVGHVIARGGDVIVKKITKETYDKVRKEITTKDVGAEGGLIIVAHGESGNIHAVQEEDCLPVRAADGHIYMEVVRPTVLDHQEHGPIVIDKGYYECYPQREYVPGAYRNVRD